VAALVVLAVLLVPAGVSAAAGATAPHSTTFSEPVFTGTLPDARAALAAPRPGSGGWYWPIGTEEFQGWSGFLNKRGSYVHVAQDMPCAAGRPVYAIADGTVFISRADAGGYGVGASPGGCIIIAHVTASGTRFHALYGHVQRLKVKAGQRVVAGQVIASVNGCRHLHFSTHVGFTYRDGNPYAGHVPASWADHGGYVDPVKFLKGNPRAATYKPPVLPVVEIATQTPPYGSGAADGAAYWTEEGAAGSATWRQDLVSGERVALAAGTQVPPFDTARYVTAVLTAPAIGFSVADRRPALTLRAVHATPAWGADSELEALLVNAAGEPLQGGILKLQRRNGSRWANVRLGVTDAEGSAVFLYPPPAATALRVVFAPPAEQPAGREYLTVRSGPETVTPHVALGKPRVPAIVEAADLVTAAGDLTPQHSAGEHTVQLVFQRRGAGGDWVTKLTVAAVNRDRADATRYVGHARLAPGSWRLQATHPADDEHAETVSAWRTFTVE
jgi:murein DD-endopeptidase MepM/ murein hydrolase activator NlpD